MGKATQAADPNAVMALCKAPTDGAEKLQMEAVQQPGGEEQKSYTGLKAGYVPSDILSTVQPVPMLHQHRKLHGFTCPFFIFYV